MRICRGRSVFTDGKHGDEYRITDVPPDIARPRLPRTAFARESMDMARAIPKGNMP